MHSDVQTKLDQLTDTVCRGGQIDRRAALRLAGMTNHRDCMALLAGATRVRETFFGTEIDVCAIMNARSGRCSEDCAFCAQAGCHAARIEVFPLVDCAAIVSAARAAAAAGACRFSIVTSGRGMRASGDLQVVCDALAEIRATTNLEPCASLGILGPEHLARLQQAGLCRYHHNLETCREFFPQVCTTHAYADRVATIAAAREIGLEVCAGGILGLGETVSQRVDLALELRQLDIQSVPLNFLNPVAGTALAARQPLPPLEILTSIAVFRYLLPQREIRVCGGREAGLRTLQPLLYAAGANGIMVGNYLTTGGREPCTDITEIVDLGLVPRQTRERDVR